MPKKTKKRPEKAERGWEALPAEKMNKAFETLFFALCEDLEMWHQIVQWEEQWGSELSEDA